MTVRQCPSDEPELKAAARGNREAPPGARPGWSKCTIRTAAEPPNYGLTMSQILKFPDSFSRRTPKDGTPQESITGTEAEMPSLPIMTGDQWSEFIRLLTPRGATFMADVWKLINLCCRWAADTPEYSESGRIHDPIMMRFCWLWMSGR